MDCVKVLSRVSWSLGTWLGKSLHVVSDVVDDRYLIFHRDMTDSKIVLGTGF